MISIIRRDSGVNFEVPNVISRTKKINNLHSKKIQKFGFA